MNRGLLTVGILVSLGGLLGLLNPALLGGIAGPRELVVAIGLVALFASMLLAHARYGRNRNRSAAPDVEHRQVARVPAPETEIDAFDQPRLSYRARRRAQKQGRNAVRELAIDVLVRYDGDSRTRAKERLDSGTWSSDPQAQAFFAPDAVEMPLSERLASIRAPDDVYRHRLNRAIAALSARIERGRTDG
ncbi:DUF7269 family protein [Halocatena halophila]|uniref:DUF7269 family protein n=1 Tax=Halocatena halophila TaxID=2814576 RepID=UPI002ED40AE2